MEGFEAEFPVKVRVRSTECRPEVRELTLVAGRNELVLDCVRDALPRDT